jgi:hypothetical protein
MRRAKSARIAPGARIASVGRYVKLYKHFKGGSDLEYL